jgi:hypothetical protein
MQLTQPIESRKFPGKTLVRPVRFRICGLRIRIRLGAPLGAKNMLNRTHWIVVLMTTALVVGCAKRGPRPSDMDVSSGTNDVVMAPARFYVTPAPVTQVNTSFKFVVLDFSSRLMPPVGTRLNVYRGAQRVGTVQITEPVRMRFATADILSGNIQVGDQAR